MDQQIVQPKIIFKQCSICLDKMILKIDICTTLCKHKFHKSCLETWNKQECPVCRQNTGAVIKIPDVIPEWIQFQIIVRSTEIALESAVQAYESAVQVYDRAGWELLFAVTPDEIASGTGVLAYPGMVPATEEWKNKCLDRLNKSRFELILAELRVYHADEEFRLARSEYDAMVFEQ